MSTEFIQNLLSGETKEVSLEELTQNRINKRKGLVADSDDQILTPEEIVSEEVVDEVEEESIDTAQPDEDDNEVVEESEEEVSESEENDEEETEEVEDLYVDLKDGTQISLSEIEELQKGSLRQADYTKKTQELAEQRKEIEEKESKFNSLISDLEEKSANLEVLIKEQDEEIDWDYLKEYDPSEYLSQKEKAEKRQKTLEEIKGTKDSLNSENQQKLVAEESSKLFTAIPEWIEDGKTTKAFENDIKLMNNYLVNNVGMSNEEIGQIVSHKHWQIIREAAKNTINVDKKVAMDKKLKKAPVVTKSHSKVSKQSVINKELSDAESRFKKSGDSNDLIALKKIRRKYAK
tara:strand:+ start:622 stop:1665 length:1044 start_codon:yes stop_codon:yes gene_type:complete